MKRILTLGLAAAIALSAIPMAYATTTHTNGTQVEYVANADMNRAYTITVPAKMTPKKGQEVTGTVTLSGRWASNETVTVTADAAVELTNSINSADKLRLGITFPTMAYAGDNTESKTYTETVILAAMPEAALFGEWTGKFNYNVEFDDGIEPTYSISTVSQNGLSAKIDENGKVTITQAAIATIDPSLIAEEYCSITYNGTTVAATRINAATHTFNYQGDGEYIVNLSVKGTNGVIITSDGVLTVVYR